MTQAPPPVYPPQGGVLRPHRGVMILVFGILSWLVCFIFGIIAWVMGNADLREMEEGRMDPTGQGLTQAGKIIGMISVILSIVGVAIAIVVIIGSLVAAGAASAAGSGP
ncbi:MAG: DUF4190 domain-containing protein [Planctomycetes bacterium]|nr:DUF4190 domain-containing protein [Planctomycetota bacterium]